MRRPEISLFYREMSNAINDTLMNEELITRVSIFLFLFFHFHFYLSPLLYDYTNIIHHVENKDLIAVKRVCKYFYSYVLSFITHCCIPSPFCRFFFEDFSDGIGISKEQRVLWKKVEKLDSLVEHYIKTIKANGHTDDFLQFSNVKDIDQSTEYAIKIGVVGDSGVGASTFLQILNVCNIFLCLYQLIDCFTFRNNFLLKVQLHKW